MKNPLQILIEPRLPGIVIPLLIAGILWFFPSSTPSNDINWVSENTGLSSWLNKLVIDMPFARELAGFLFAIILSLFLIQLNQTFTLIRTRTFLPFYFFLILLSANIHTHNFNFAYLSSLFLLTAIWQMFLIYDHREPIAELFNVGLLIGFGSLFASELLLFTPLFFVGVQILKGFSFRSLLALAFGLATPFLLILGIIYVLNEDITHYINLFVSQLDFDLYLHIDNYSIAFLLSISIIGLLTVLNIINNPFSDKIRVSKMLGQVALGFFFCVGIFFLKADNSAIIYINGAIFSSLLFGHYFSLSTSLFSKILFAIQMLACFGYFFISL